MTRTRRPGGLCVLVLMALVLVALPAVPATAEHSPPPSSDVAGTGILHGTELVEDQVFLGQPCFAVARHVFGLQGEGSYAGRTADGQEVIYQAQLAEGQPVHEGPLQVQVENTEPYHHGPNGTHGNDSSCSTATAGTPVPAAFKIFAAEGAEDTDGDADVDILTGAAWVYRLDDTGAQVPCTGQGTYARTASGQNWHADWTLSEDCTVVGNAAGMPGEGIAPAYTAHTHLGTHGPCTGGCVDNFKVDYKQYPPVPGLSMGMSGPSYKAIGQTATVTAGVTNDGAPVPNAAVAFTVTGPGPATPAGGPALTGDDGRASFTFTATVEGDYTVTASVTQLDQSASASHVVRFAVPAPAMTLSALDRSQTEDPVLVVATVVDENAPFDYDANGDPRRAPVPGAIVDFAVSGAGQATPASGSATTDTMGRASFTFAGDRAGDYTVSASTTYLGQQTSATHTVHLDVKTLSREGAIAASDPPSSSERLLSAVIDPAGAFAYFGTTLEQVVKVDLTDFRRVGTIDLDGVPYSAVIDPAGDFAYFGTSGSPGKVVKVDLATFTRVGAITLAAGENNLESAVIDPAGAYAYFGTNTNPGRVVKVDLATFTRVGAITLAAGENWLSSAVIDPAGNFAYFGGSTGVVKIDLNGFQRAGAVALPEDERGLSSAVIDPAGTFAYFGTEQGGQGGVVKIDLNTLQRVGAVAMPSNVYDLTSAVIDPAGNFAYFGAVVSDYEAILYSPLGPFAPNSWTTHAYAPPTADGVVKVDLNAFELAHVLALGEGEENLASAVIDPAGTHAYFGTSFSGSAFHNEDDIPTKVVKLSLTRPPNPALVAGDDGYNTDYLTPLEVPAPGVLANDTDTRVGNGDALTAHLDRRPAGGSVVLNRDGSFTYTPDEGFSGTETFTYLASDGYDYSAPATVSIEVAPPPEGVRGSAYGFYSSVSLFGGPAEPRGPDPSVTLPASGSATPVTATAPTGDAVYGPADIFTSGQLDVATQGTSGPDGSVASSTKVANVNRDGNEVFTADNVSSTCEATGSGVSATTSITNGTLRTSEGDPNVEGDDTVVAIPANPAPNTVYKGQLESVGDHFEYILNKQVVNPDGSITVYAAHQRLLGPTAIGDLYIGKAVCGMTTAGGGNAAPTATDDAYTTGRDTALEVPAPGVLANDTDADGDALSATSASDPAGGSVTLSPDGSFTYSPDAGFVGIDTFTYTADDANGGTATATVSMTVEAIKARVADFDGDGDTDRSVFRKGAWYAEGQPPAFFGVSGDIPVPSDYDGDGTSDRAVYRNGAWHVAGQPTVFLGNATDIPVPGDYNGDGKVDRAVYRNGAWHIQGQPTVFLGNSTDIPVPGDYDGDGDTEAAIYRNGAWHIHGQATVFHGVGGDIPVPGDYDGNGTTEAAVYRKGAWHVAGQPTVFLGNASDVPVPGDYNGDASTDRGVFRPSAGGWYVQGQPNAFLGVNGDIPLPLPQAIYRAFF